MRFIYNALLIQPIAVGERFWRVEGKRLILRPHSLTMELLTKYFDSLSELQKVQFGNLLPLYEDWNSKINVVSRKDMVHFYERHVLHSLAIAKFVRFNPGTKVMDAGTGGGFPGIPLAILFPDAHFTLVDSIGKKIMVVADVAEKLGLANVTVQNKRIEQVDGKFDFIVSRAVTALPVFLGWTKGKLKGNSQCSRANGIIYLKGGDLSAELSAAPKDLSVKAFDLSTWFEEEFFETKKMVHVY